MDKHNALIELIEELGDEVKAVKRAVQEQKNQLEMSTDQNMGWLAYALPQNESDMQVAMNGSRYLRVLQLLDEWCRKISKYAQDHEDERRVVWWERPDESFEPAILLDDLRDEIRMLMAAENVSLEDGE
jgi:hypothetical protein